MTKAQFEKLEVGDKVADSRYTPGIGRVTKRELRRGLMGPYVRLEIRFDEESVLVKPRGMNAYEATLIPYSVSASYLKKLIGKELV